tara:strand:- start:1837 stop:2934 length:1098 start_codon:yes stop_codon:yes gene_type:complete
MEYKVISANRSSNRAPKNWRVHEREMLETHFGNVLDVNGEDGSSVLDAYEKHKDTITHIRWYPDPENITRSEYDGMVSQSQIIGNIPYITNSAEGFINVQSKDTAFEVWQDAGVNCPEFFTYDTTIEFYNKLEESNITYPYLLRLNNSVSGKHTYAVRSESDLQNALLLLEADFNKSPHRIKTTKMCIKLVDSVDHENKVNSSFRIHVAGDNVVSGYARVVDGTDWLAITAGKFKPSHMDNFIKYNMMCERIMTEHRDELCKAVTSLGLNHQGVDVIIDRETNKLCFLEVQPTYSAGYPLIKGHMYGNYKLPYYNPYDPFLVDFLQKNESELSLLLPTYYNNWLDKRNHFDMVYKSLKEYTNVRT